MPSMLLSHIKQCRLTTLVTPQQHPEVEVRVAILSRSDDTITFRGTIGKGEEVYMELKGELTNERLTTDRPRRRAERQKTAHFVR